MNHKKFVITSTVLMFLVVGIVAGLALYSGLAVKASIRDLPEAVAFIPVDCKAVFGMNVQKFVASPVYKRFEEKNSQKIGKDLDEFISKTGVDPRKDIAYIVAGGRENTGKKGEGVIIAVGQFNTAAIKTFISSKSVPIPVQYKKTDVWMIPESDGNKLEKGIAFLKESELGLGDLESLKAVIDARENPNLLGIKANPVLAPIIDKLNPDEMFWFAGDASSMLAKAPTNTPFGTNLAAIQYVVGTLNMTDAVAGKIIVTARDADSAKKLGDVVRGIKALGQLATDQNAELATLLGGINIETNDANNSVTLVLNFPIDLLDRLENAKPQHQFKKVI